MTAYVPRSPHLAAWVAKAIDAGRDELAEAYRTGVIETIPAASRNRLWGLRRAAEYRHLQWGRRRTQRSPDRQKSYERRHRLAWSGPLPGFLAGRLTIGDMAVARIVADEHLRRWFCDLSLDEIAARAGVCRKTAKRALRRLRLDGLISIEERPIKGRKSLTNVIRIISREWKCWLEKRVTMGPPSEGIGGHLGTPTDTTVRKKAGKAIGSEIFGPKRSQSPLLPRASSP